MLFHMLRRSLGDHSFIEGLRRFYTDNRFKQAGYQELKQAFESVSKRDLGEFFEQWTGRTGAPRLELRDLQLSSQKNGSYLLQGKVVQTQPEPLFILEAPILTHFADGGSRRTRLLMKQREQAFELKLRQPPVQVDLDPWYDLFRQILPGEAPQTLSKLFGSEEALIVLPANAPQSSNLPTGSSHSSGQRAIPTSRSLLTSNSPLCLRIALSGCWAGTTASCHSSRRCCQRDRRSSAITQSGCSQSACPAPAAALRWPAPLRKAARSAGLPATIARHWPV
ncbi:hypothetical protein [endosymbiont of Riftia pachyptila]|uniref:Peptidase M28 n=1 Tax=endosymbiont of Riftia pachyptila (vent Ph05) TaxID=1048808 RepID=G2DBI5_9GAMM|nr:hypothetical protein [endosymbiont of Riftia pachyptila]EGV52051.1 peptidase M28 [endosymbiont of Riftia pachyptila (vent Ph05)]